MISENLEKALQNNKELKEIIIKIANKFDNRAKLVGGITRETMYLMATEMKMAFLHFGLDARIIINKVDDLSANIILCSNEEEKKIFEKKK